MASRLIGYLEYFIPLSVARTVKAHTGTSLDSERIQNVKTFTTVLLLRSVELVGPWKTEHYAPGEVTLPSDLAQLCLKNKWAKLIKVAQHGDPKHNH